MPPQRREWAGRLRLDVRLVGIFVAVSLLPLAVSDWIAMSAIGRIGTSLQADLGQKTTKQVSLQVFDRLATATELLQTLDAPEAGAPPPRLIAPNGPFAALEAEPRDAIPSTARTQPATGDRYAIRGELRAKPGGGKDVVLHAIDADGAAWRAVMDTDALWLPLVSASGDSTWTVREADGDLIVAAQGNRVLDAAFASPSGEGTQAFTSDLYLAASLGTGDWTFTQVARVPELGWQGRPLLVWLTLVGVATLLLIAALSQWLIRKSLEPLKQLASATRDVATGALDTRVEPRRQDELGRLAGAFNDMAQRIQRQLASLRSLSALDRDVLENASIERLARHIAAHLELIAPRSEATFTWLDGEAGANTARIAHGALLDVGATHLGAAERERFAIEGDAVSAHARAQQLVVRVGGATRGVLVVRTDEPLADDALSALQDFRDRIAVAFAARQRDKELAWQALHDSLTGLPSRRALDAALDAATLAVGRGETTALLLVDLDHFKDVNDSRGHAAGDELICEAARRLAAIAPARALVARQGGDEFAILLDDADAALATARTIVAVLAEPFRVAGGDFVLGASVGVATAPAHASTGIELLRCADVALYGAKAAGRGTLVEYSSALDRAAQSRVQLETDLRSALSRAEFRLAWQPRVDARSGRIVACEALIRWQHPVRGEIGPAEFIPIAEEIGAIDAIGAWVIDEACRQLHAWDRAGVTMRRISVNVSPRQLESGDLFDRVVAALEAHAIEPARLELEITESLLIGDIEHVFRQLTRIRGTGVTIALDDFGTGHSSMATLAALPYDAMKIDRSFVAVIDDGERIVPIVRSIATMALSAKLRLVAEGVETEAQARIMASFGCHELQGRLFGMPMPSDALARLVADKR